VKAVRRIEKHGEYLIHDRFFLFNNLWGAETGTGTQSLWEETEQGPSVAWGTRWDWNGSLATIKSYAAIVLGWHWGWRVSDTGLPVRLDSIRRVGTRWTFKLIEETPGKYNVSYDCWFSDNPKNDQENPTGEVMVWLTYTENVTPIGSLKNRVNIGGTEWELWQGPHPVSGWPVYSFLRTVQTDTEMLDLKDFFQYLTHHGFSGLDYLLSVEAGIEVFAGVGRLETSAYTLEIEC
jgi:xyloglucan-specific endo-beta-1,4-glucanase